MTRSNEYFTSAGVMTSPLWKRTPLRILNSHWVSEIAFHEVASDGSNWSLMFRCSRESNMLMFTRIPTRSKCMWGSRVGAWDTRATVSVSLAWAETGAVAAASAKSARTRTAASGAHRFIGGSSSSADRDVDEGGGDLKGLPSVYHRPPGQHNAPPRRHDSPALVPAVRWPKPEKPMRVITQLPNDDLRRAQAAARVAEAAGFDGVVALENAHGPYLPLAAAALATEGVQLGTAVAMAFPRSPTITAHQAWDLQQASGGRFYLGLGSQVKAHNERRYGIPWVPPAPRLRDYIGAVRAIWRCWEQGEPLDYRSAHYTLSLMTPNFAPRPTGLPRVPVSMAAIGPAMLRVAGEVCDGVRLHPFCTRRYVEEVCLPRLGEGLDRAARGRGTLEVVGGGLFAVVGTYDTIVAEIEQRYRGGAPTRSRSRRRPTPSRAPCARWWRASSGSRARSPATRSAGEGEVLIIHPKGAA